MSEFSELTQEPITTRKYNYVKHGSMLVVFGAMILCTTRYDYLFMT